MVIDTLFEDKTTEATRDTILDGPSVLTISDFEVLYLLHWSSLIEFSWLIHLLLFGSELVGNLFLVNFKLLVVVVGILDQDLVRSGALDNNARVSLC